MFHKRWGSPTPFNGRRSRKKYDKPFFIFMLPCIIGIWQLLTGAWGNESMKNEAGAKWAGRTRREYHRAHFIVGIQWRQTCKQLYTFSDVFSIYRESQVVLWFLCRISAIFGLNAKRPSNKQLSFAFSHWNPDSWAQNKHPLLNGNHVLAPTRQSFAKKKVQFSQIDISQRISGVFFREKKQILTYFPLLRKM